MVTKSSLARCGRKEVDGRCRFLHGWRDAAGVGGRGLPGRLDPGQRYQLMHWHSRAVYVLWQRRLPSYGAQSLVANMDPLPGRMV